ncbi:unnamed protein product, partial [Prorocentrum cordatum]
VWQLWEYLRGRAPPLGPLRFLDQRWPWRAYGWRPPLGGDAEALRRWQAGAPAAALAAAGGLRDAGAGPCLDVEPPGAVTRLHRAEDGAHELVAVLSGEKEWLLYPPEDSDRLLPGWGLCDPWQSPVNPAAEQPPLGAAPRAALLGAGDVLVVPRGWWWWARTRAAGVTLRQSVVDDGCAREVAQARRAREDERRAAAEEGPALLQQVRGAVGERGGNVAWLRCGSGPAAARGQYVALHFATYAEGAELVECSRGGPHPCVVEAQ